MVVSLYSFSNGGKVLIIPEVIIHPIVVVISETRMDSSEDKIDSMAPRQSKYGGYSVYRVLI